MDAQTALNEILSRNAAGNPMSVAELRSLAASVDASAGNATVATEIAKADGFDGTANTGPRLQTLGLGAEDYTNADLFHLLQYGAADARVKAFGDGFWMMPYAIKNGGQTLDCSDRIPYN